MVLSLLFGCPESGALSQGVPRLVLDPPVVDFGTVFVGNPVEVIVSARSEGGTAVRYDARFGPGFGEGLELGPASASVAADSERDVLVRLLPTVEGAREAEVMFDYGTRTATLTVRARVEEPPDCEDGNICTLNTFDFDTGRCETVATTSECNDLDACTIADQCVEAICLGQSANCDDDDICTDDFCDRQSGCVHILARSCDDGNPCTQDFCDPDAGCAHRNEPDATPCGGEQCKVGSICIDGQCNDFPVPDGSECNDGDFCSKNDQCSSGDCRDPSFPYPGDGELQWATFIGPLAPGASRNPVVDAQGSVFAGVVQGVVGVDQCGELLWENRGLGTPDADSMLLTPLGLVVPLTGAGELVMLELGQGEEVRRVSLRPLLEGRTSTTAAIESVDLVVRRSEALVGSLWVEPDDGSSPFGLIYEVSSSWTAPTVRVELGSEHAAQLALDADESIVALLRRGEPDAPRPEPERILRLGPSNLPEQTWSSSSIETVRSSISIDAQGHVLWTAGLQKLSRRGEAQQLGPPAKDPFARVMGQAVVDGLRTYTVEIDQSAPPGLGESFLVVGRQTGETDPVLEAPLPGLAFGATPTIDDAGNVYAVTQDGQVSSWDAFGTLRYELELPVGAGVFSSPSVTLAPTNLLVIVGAEAIYGVEAVPAPGTSAWFRYRRDNFTTGHR